MSIGQIAFAAFAIIFAIEFYVLFSLIADLRSKS